MFTIPLRQQLNQPRVPGSARVLVKPLRERLLRCCHDKVWRVPVRKPLTQNVFSQPRKDTRETREARETERDREKQRGTESEREREKEESKGQREPDGDCEKAVIPNTEEAKRNKYERVESETKKNKNDKGRKKTKKLEGCSETRDIIAHECINEPQKVDQRGTRASVLKEKTSHLRHAKILPVRDVKTFREQSLNTCSQQCCEIIFQ